MARPARSRSLVLVVDDDAALRDSIRALLESMDFVVSTAAHAGEAVGELTAQRPDVILTDICMTGGDGFELINAINDFHEDIPVVAMSGGTCEFGLRENLGIAKRLGAASTIAKPFRPALLVETIDRAIAGRNPVTLEM